LAALRRLRGTPFDLFGRTEERREERQLVEDYCATIEQILARMDHIDLDIALALARLPDQIRGYGHVKQASIAAVRKRWQTLEQELLESSMAADRVAVAG
jgi:indolepyruvate ferredoxin oxidoreductase